jgi:hypothetical protein
VCTHQLLWAPQIYWLGGVWTLDIRTIPHHGAARTWFEVPSSEIKQESVFSNPLVIKFNLFKILFWTTLIKLVMEFKTSRRPITAKARVLPKKYPGDQSGTGECSSLSTSVVHCQHYSTNTPYICFIRLAPKSRIHCNWQSVKENTYLLSRISY